MNLGFVRFVAVAALCAACSGAARGEDTFSIVAVDPLTDQVGSAGASCISGSIIISDVHPGVGAIHTQSYWNGQNQSYARMLMDMGYSPEAIIDSLIANDATGNPSIRQYGIVDLVDGGRSAAYTGSNCINYKGHILGPTYAIQGNILLGPQILEDMESGFLATQGTLADKLMSALQGANVPGADTRCASSGRPAISAFIRVARPGDTPSDLYLDLNVNNTSQDENPIDILQEMYDDWVQTTSAPGVEAAGRPGPLLLQNRPNPFATATAIVYVLPRPEHVRLRVFDTAGRVVATLVEDRQGAGRHRASWEVSHETPSGVYLYRLEAGESVQTRKLQLMR
jgi:uncharacterized Ntn-hydrolase superfamily protein